MENKCLKREKYENKTKLRICQSSTKTYFHIILIKQEINNLR